MPPFTALSREETRFIGLEENLLESRDMIRSFVAYETLTYEQAIEAMAAINQMSSLIVTMNRSIDVMIDYAEAISALEVEGEHPFEDNDLVELLERLRDLLYRIELELTDFLESPDNPNNPNMWDSVEPFITLFLVSSDLYLGESLEGGGYLFYNGSFRQGRQVNVSMDGGLLLTATTYAQGRYNFSYAVPVNASWLGAHQLVANSSYAYGTLVSDTVTFRIHLIPTFLSISVNKELLPPEETLSIQLLLRDANGEPVSGGKCNLTVSPMVIPLQTDFEGESSWADLAQDIGFGSHSVHASYDAELPYASSNSRSVTVTVNIPTTMQLEVVTDRLVYKNYYYVSGFGTLLANGSEPLEGMTVTLSIDGEEALNVTTRADGDFAFSIDRENLSVGAHTLTAEFLYRDKMWRYCFEEDTFTILARKKVGYPFWPFIPGWQNLGPSLTYPDIFFGPNSYITWLFMILVLGAIIKALQVRKSIARKKVAEQAKLAKSEAFGIADQEIPVFGGPAMAAESGSSTSPTDPNARVIWHYNRFVRFLVAKLFVGISANMTHREIAQLLGKIGYPLMAIDRITLLFEKAMYSGSRLSDSESNSMENMVSDFERSRSKEGSVAT
jgi:hypothetical protein